MEIFIEDDYQKMRCRIYLKEVVGNHITITGYDPTTKELVNHVVEEGFYGTVDVDPLLTIPLFMKDKLIKAFITEGKKNHLSVEEESLLKGKSMATETHLSDMREIAFMLLKDKIR